MVVQAVIALALALPTGALFGVGYGTGVRIGYEQIYPLLFPAGKRPDPTQTQANIKSINNIYNAIGGKEASQMGIGKGLSDAMSELNKNPDFQALAELELKLSGNTRSSSDRGADFKTSSDTLQDTSYSDLQEQVANKTTDRETQWRLAKQQLSSFDFQVAARKMSLEELSYWLRNKTKFNLISETINVLNFYKQQKLKTIRETGPLESTTPPPPEQPEIYQTADDIEINAFIAEVATRQAQGIKIQNLIVKWTQEVSKRNRYSRTQQIEHERQLNIAKNKLRSHNTQWFQWLRTKSLHRIQRIRQLVAFHNKNRYAT